MPNTRMGIRLTKVVMRALESGQGERTVRLGA
jgi:hypothetical protein